MAPPKLTPIEMILKAGGISKVQTEAVAEQKPPAELNIRQALFCIYYTQNNELRGNGTHSYAEAYGYDFESLPDDNAIYIGKGKARKCIQESTRTRAYNVCASEASKMLKNPKIQKYLYECLNALLQDNITDARLSEIINQRNDLSTSLAGIREYNRLHGRIVDKKSLTDAEGQPLAIVGLVIHAPATGKKQ